jgi:hypothetical protein
MAASHKIPNSRYLPLHAYVEQRRVVYIITRVALCITSICDRSRWIESHIINAAVPRWSYTG